MDADYVQEQDGQKINKKQKQIGHHARLRRASATAPLRTGADMCKTGSAAGKCAGAKSNTVRRRSNHAHGHERQDRGKQADGCRKCFELMP